VIVGEIIPQNDRNPPKRVEKKVYLNKIKGLYKIILNNEAINTSFSVLSKIFIHGIIITPFLIMVVDLTQGYTWGWKTLLHIIGCGSGYSFVEDIVDKVKHK